MNMREKIIAILRSTNMMLPYDAQAVAHADAIIVALREQEPVHWRAVLDKDQVPQQLNPDLHVVGFRQFKAAESWIASNLDFDGWRYALEPLYALPIPPVEQASLGERLAAAEKERDRWYGAAIERAEWQDKYNKLIARGKVRCTAEPVPGSSAWNVLIGKFWLGQYRDLKMVGSGYITAEEAAKNDAAAINVALDGGVTVYGRREETKEGKWRLCRTWCGSDDCPHTTALSEQQPGEKL